MPPLNSLNSIREHPSAREGVPLRIFEEPVPARDLALRLLLLASVVLSPVCAQRGGPYRLKAGDQIRMSVFQESNLLTEVQFIQSGEASFPLNGPVNLAGQTPREAESAVTALYNADYLVLVVRAEATPIAPVRRAPRDPR